MRKIIIYCLAFLILGINTLSISSVHAQAPDMSILSIKVDKPQYNIGDKIIGEIYLQTDSSSRQFDMILQTSISVEVDGKKMNINAQTQDSDVYIDSNSSRVISFEHILSKDVGGEVKLMARIYSPDGMMIAENSVPITIVGIPEKRILPLPKAEIEYNQETFTLQAGPTIKANDKLSLNIQTGIIGEGNNVITPTITIYNRTHLSKPIRSILLDQIILKDNTSYSFEIPTDFDPLVYAGVLSFESDRFNIPPVYFRYIIEGTIGTILNASTDKLEGESGEIISVKVQYAGTPIIINSTNISAPNAKKVDVFVKIYNEENAIVGESSANTNLNESSGEINIPITLTQKAKQIRLEVMMKEGEKILSTYTTSLPTEDEIASQENKTKNRNLLYLLTTVVVISLLSLIYAAYKKKIITKIPTVVLMGLIVLSSVLFGVHSSNANSWTIYSPSDSFLSSTFNGYINLNKTSYAPGETFKPYYQAYFPACLNTTFNNEIYATANDWENFNVNVNEVEALFVGYSSAWGDSALTTKIPILVNWWKSKGGYLIWETNSNSSAFETTPEGNQDVVNSYFVYPNKTYTAPTVPGKYKIFGMFINRTGANMAAPRIAYADVCVRGSGVCWGENDVCPNLTGNFTKDSSGVIYKDGVATNYENSDGYCKEKIVSVCNEDHFDGQQECLGGTSVVYWWCQDSIATWQPIYKNISCPNGAWCESGGTSVNQEVAFYGYPTYQSSGGVYGDFEYRWKIDGYATTTRSASLYTISKSFSTTGTKNATVYVTKDNETKVGYCSIEVVCGLKPDDGKETPCTNGYKDVYRCTNTGWILQNESCTGVDINAACTVSTTNPLINTSVTYTAPSYNDVTYKWYLGTSLTPISNATSSIYIKSYNVNDINKNLKVTITDGGVTYEKVCPLVKYQDRITFKANGGIGPDYYQSINFNESTNLISNTFTKGGNVFGGWMASPSGSVLYNNAASYTMTSTSPKTLYAKWNQIVYTLTANKAGTGTGEVKKGTSLFTSQGFSSGELVTLIASSTNNSTFTSWTGCNSTSGVNCNVTMDSSKTVTATFTTGPVIPPGGPPSISKFKFVPNIADASTRQCLFNLEATNVTECYTKNRLGGISGNIATTSANTISITSTNPRYLSIGAHTLYCNGTDLITLNKKISTEICYSNADFREN